MEQHGTGMNAGPENPNPEHNREHNKYEHNQVIIRTTTRPECRKNTFFFFFVCFLSFS